ncbi:MAG: alpha-galactosidase [Clostridia bacterium]|nr:alpha-galactosidase [Clostridia bacterium]
MSITFEKSQNTFYLDGKGVTYALYINEVGYPCHMYFGAEITHDGLRHTRGVGRTSRTATPPGMDVGKYSYQNYLPEYAFFGTGDFREPAVVVENSTGDRICDLLYDSYEILPEKPAIVGMPSMRGGETLVIHLRDKISNIGADLYYTVYDDCSVIARRAVIRNYGDTACRLHRAYSFSMGLPGQDYNITTLHGGWACERNMETIPMHHGVVSVDSKRCSSSDTLSPFMGIFPSTTSEHLGDAYGVCLIYSSSFVLTAEGVVSGDTVITGGINDFNFTWKLEAGESLETPEALIAFSDEGIGGMSRAFHDAYRNHLINPRFVNQSRPIVINNWEATYMDFDTDKLKAIVDSVAGTGIDTFVLDDGWFRVRDDEFCSLGDWKVNGNKLVGGLKAIVEYVHSKEMRFGLWFEPEMVSEDSDLFREHPDYAIGMPTRERCYTRHQFVLDITREDVRDYIVNTVNSVIRDNNIDYVKWDCNRHVTDVYSVGREADRQAEFAHRYALGLYDLCERIVNANPNVFFEGCSSGGARFDGGILYYFPQIWTSDNSDAEDRTRIQYSTSLIYPLSSMSCHISTVPNHQNNRVTKMSTRADIAHLGATGYELDTTKLSAEEIENIGKQVEEYKQTEELILRGDLYRIDNPFESNFFTEMVVSKDKSEAILCAYRRQTNANPEIKRIRLSGLDKRKMYRIAERDITASGATLMNAGMVIHFPNEDYISVVYHIREI